MNATEKTGRGKRPGREENAIMNPVVYGAAGPSGGERELAYRLLSAALARECGILALPEIEREKGGKPYFPALPHIHFNLSHSHGAAVCALSDSPVGVDVEKLRPAPKRLAGNLGDEAFFRLWTAREAAVKLRGEGLAALLKRPAPDKPDSRCQCLEGFLPGYIVTVCPSEWQTDPIRFIRIF